MELQELLNPYALPQPHPPHFESPRVVETEKDAVQPKAHEHSGLCTPPDPLPHPASCSRLHSAAPQLCHW